MGFDERGELMGHISIGLELVNSLWRKMQTGRTRAPGSKLAPADRKMCRLHLLHLIGFASRRAAVRLADLSENARSDGAQLHR